METTVIETTRRTLAQSATLCPFVRTDVCRPLAVNDASSFATIFDREYETSNGTFQHRCTLQRFFNRQRS